MDVPPLVGKGEWRLSIQSIALRGAGMTPHSYMGKGTSHALLLVSILPDERYYDNVQNA